MNDYVTFTSTGIHVDLDRFLKTEAGRKTMAALAKASKKFEYPCPNCGSPDYSNDEPKAKP